MIYKGRPHEKPSGLQIISYIASSVKTGTELKTEEMNKSFGYLGYEQHEVDEYLSVIEGTNFLMDKGNIYVVLGATPVPTLPPEFEEVLEEQLENIINKSKLKKQN